MKHLSHFVHSPVATALAVLSAQVSTDPQVGLGILSGRLEPLGEDGWAQLLPAGYFSAVDGRPHDVPGQRWFLDGEIAARLIAGVQQHHNDRLIDYEHQTLKTEENGQPAPAAGWFNAAEMEWREGDGLYVRPRWTDKAKGFIDADEYRWLSAVFPYDKRTGAPLQIQMAALVNYPGLDGLKDVAALAGLFSPEATPSTPPNNHPEEIEMEQWLKDLLTSLGIDVDGDSISPEKGKAILSAVKTLQTQAGQVDGLNTKIATLKAQSGSQEVDLTQYVPKAMYDEAVVEIASLKVENSEQSIDQLVSEAIADGRAFAREEQYLKDLGKQQGLAALKVSLDNRTPIAALTQTQTSTTTTPKKKDQDHLTDEDVAVLKATGLAKEDYLKQRGQD